MDQYQLLQNINAYRLSPHLFTDEDVDLLGKYAKEYQIPFERNMDAEEGKQTSMVGQFLGGAVTTAVAPFNIFGGKLSDPVTTAQQISRSLGELFGFIPGIVGGPMAWAGKGALKLGLKGAARSVAKGVVTTGEVLANTKTVPIRLADVGVEYGVKSIGRASATAGQFLESGSKVSNLVRSAAHLGTASALTEVWEGPDATWNAAVHGAIAGGAFASIGNFVNMGKMMNHPNPKVRAGVERWWVDTATKGALGSIFQGGQATANDAPTAIQIYEYLLGGFFGATHPTPAQRLGREFVKKYNKSDVPKKDFFKMLEDPQFESLGNVDKNAQEWVRDFHAKAIGQEINTIVTQGGQEIRNAFGNIYQNYADKYNIKVKDMTKEQRTEAEYEQIEPLLDAYDNSKETTKVTREMSEVKDPEKYSERTKEIYDELTPEEVALVKRGDFSPVYNRIDKMNQRPSDSEVDYTDPRSIESHTIVDQPEINSRPGLRDFVLNIRERAKDEGYTEAQIIESSIKAYDKAVGKEKPKPDVSKRKETSQKLYDRELKNVEATDDPLKKLTAIQKMKNRMRHDESDTSDIESIISPIEAELKAQGYEIQDLQGKPYRIELELRADFIPDENLRWGEAIIHQIRKPQIMKDGKMVQAANVVVRQGVKKLTPKEFKQEKLRLKKEWLSEKKIWEEMGLSESQIAEKKKKHDRYAKLTLDELPVGKEKPVGEADVGEHKTLSKSLEELRKEKEEHLKRVRTEYGEFEYPAKIEDIEKAFWNKERGLVTRYDKEVDLAPMEEAAARTHLGEFEELSAKKVYNEKRREYQIMEDTSVKIDFLPEKNEIVLSVLEPSYSKAEVFDMLYSAADAIQKKLNISPDTNITVKTKHTFEKPLNKLSDITGKPAEEPVDTNARYQRFVNIWESEYPDVRADEKIKRKLKQVFIRLEQNGDKPKNFLTYNTFTRKTELKSNYNLEGQRISEFSPSKPHDEMNNTTSLELKDVKREGRSYNPFAKYWKQKRSGYGYDYTDVMEPGDWYRMLWHQATKFNSYMWLPNKDKGRVIFRNFHPDAKDTKITDVLDAKDLKHYYTDLKNFLDMVGVKPTKTKSDVMKRWRNLHEKMTISNMLFDPEAPFKNARDAVKRASLLSSHDYKLMPKDYLDIAPDGKLNVIMVDMAESGKKMPKPETYFVMENGKKVKKTYDSDADGWMVLHTDLYKRVVDSMGFDPSTSRLKQSAAVRIDGKLFLIKAGTHPSRPEFDALMPSKNSMIVSTSAGKKHPGKEYLLYDFMDSVKIRDKKGITVEKPEHFQMNLEDLRMNLGVYENHESLTSRLRFKKQFHSFLNPLQVNPKGQKALMDIFDTAVDGDPKQNAYVKKLIENPDLPYPKDFNIKDIGHKEIVDILNSDNQRNKLVKDLHADMINDTRYFETADEIGTVKDLLDAKTYVPRLEELLKTTNYNITSVRYLESMTENYNDLIMRYIRNKYLYPRWKWGTHGWIAANDPVMKSKLKNKEISEGTFMFGWSAGESKVKSGVTLKELWQSYNDPKITPKAKKRIAEELEYAIMRVPSPDVSGTRILRFDGFVGKKGDMPDYGVYTRQKDHFYLDGADVDSDGVFTYQGLPKAFKAEIKKNAKNLENAAGVNKPNKNPAHNKLYGSEPNPKDKAYLDSKVSQHLPFALAQAGKSAFSGKEGIGTIVNAKTLMNQILSDAIMKNNGKIDLAVYNDEGQQTAVIKGNTSKAYLKNFHDGYWTHSLESSSRVADSSNFPTIKDQFEITSILAKKAIKDLRVFKWDRVKNRPTKEEIDFKFSMFRKTDYNDLWDANHFLYGRDHENRRRYTLDAVQDNIKNFEGRADEYTSSIWHLASRMSRYRVNTDLMRFIDYDKWKYLFNAFNRGFKDPTIKDLIKREVLTIKPFYGEERIKKYKSGKNMLPDGGKGRAILMFNDMMDLYSAVVVSRASDNLRREMVVAENGESYSEFSKFIADEVFKNKDAMVIMRNTGKGLRRSSLKSIADVEKAVADTKKQIKELSLAYGIDPKVSERFHDFYMLGSLWPQSMSLEKFHQMKLDKLNFFEQKIAEVEKPTKRDLHKISILQQQIEDIKGTYHKTTYHSYPFKSRQVLNQSKRDFLGGFGTTFDLFQSREGVYKRSEPIHDTIRDNISNEVDQTSNMFEKDQKTKEILEKKTEKNVFNLFELEESAKQKDIPTETRQAAKDIVDIFNSFPEHAIEYVSDMFTAMVAERDAGGGYGINKATFTDIIHFRNYLREIQGDRPKGDKLTAIDLFKFHSRQAEQQFAHDFSSPFKQTIPYKNSKGDWESRNIRVPLGTMGYLQNAFGSIYKFENVAKNLAQEDRDSYYGWKKSILDMKNGTTEWDNLHRAGMAYWLRDAGQKVGEKESYAEQWKLYEPLYDKMKDRSYNITIDGVLKKKTGAEVMDWIAEKHDKRYGSIYEMWVKGKKGDIPDYSLVDVDKISGKGSAKPDYVAFNNKSKKLKFDPKTGKANLKYLFDNLILPILGGDLRYMDIIGKDGFTFELLHRMQYEYALEQIIKNNTSIKNPKRYREKYRSQKSDRQIFGVETDPVPVDNPSRFIPVGQVENKYWSHMLHTSTKAGRKMVKEYMEHKRAEMRNHLQYQLRTRYGIGKATQPSTEFKFDKRYLPNKTDRDYIEESLTNEIMNKRIGEVVERKVAQLENNFETTLGRSLSDDNGSTETAKMYVELTAKKASDVEKSGFNNRPGSGRARGEEPLPGYSLDFEVMEKYESQWITSMFKNVTALIAKKKIDDYIELNPLKNMELTEQWATLMKDYTKKTLGGPDLFSTAMLGLRPSEIKKMEKYIKDYEKHSKTKKREGITDATRQIYNTYKKELADDKKFSIFKKGLYYKVSDESGVKLLDYISTRMWGRDGRPKLPFYGELPKSPEVRKRTLARILHNIGAFEAKWSLITLLSHPKTWIGNVLGGSHNTISQVGLRNFLDARDHTKLLNTIFRDAKLADGTKIATKDHLQRFAEEQGALESFYVTEASLERSFKGKNTKAFLDDFIRAVRKDPDLKDSTLYEMAKKHGITKAFVDTAASFMRSSERLLRRDSFFAHYLNSHEILKNIIPDIKYNNPYLINMAVKGVEATQFLYHSAFRTNYSNTALGKIMTRFHPFAWNSIRLRRLGFRRAKRYGFDPETKDFQKFQRLLTMDLVAMVLANVFQSSVFDSALPPPMSYLQDTADWLFGDEKERERAFFSSWPHPLLAPLQIVTPPVARYLMTPMNATINGNWDRFASYYLWTFFPFGRLGRSIKRTIEVPEMWMEQLGGIPIHTLGREMRKLGESEPS